MADDKRIIQYPEVESVNVSDYMMMDSASNGTTRYQVQRLLSQASAEAQNKVDAEAAARAAADTEIDERVTANETDIAGLKTDFTALSAATVKLKGSLSGVDMNTIQGESAQGIYAIGGSNTNLPTNANWGVLICIYSFGGSHQLAYNANGLWVRSYTGSPKAWTAWKYASLTTA